ncbi:hypothetical protein [Sabulicella glaciei]|uniref:DUF4412 domain-containing protein n=1 Tax=Sabulicella glaciei TaxID=2984948 RepID=A0ABT3NXE3_9PROT|nr:hypothetical protein [Roseococcus sp. MDT2-1-1]MCW8086795.1 hypothetical protein [Roseococcus sp. MDT2-1-1]
MHRLIIAALLAAAPAVAQERPSVTPTRDATVTYRLQGTPGGAAGGSLSEMRIGFLAAQQLIRLDLPTGGGYIVADSRARTGFLVSEAQRAVVVLPPGSGTAGMLPHESANYTREGADTVAGFPCTLWRVDDAGRSARACITTDGLILRAEGQNGRMEAVAVDRTPLDPRRFERPTGFRVMQAPSDVPAGAGATLPRGTALPPPGLPGR